MVTFVCSVGNVPFGTILWTNGLPFGSVLSYIYSDLIIPPILEAYDEYYGTRFAAILGGTIFVAAVVTGVLMHVLFSGFGLVPSRAAAHVASLDVALDYKAVLNVLATVLFVALYWLHRSGRSETGSGHGGHEGSHATDD